MGSEVLCVGGIFSLGCDFLTGNFVTISRLTDHISIGKGLGDTSSVVVSPVAVTVVSCIPPSLTTAIGTSVSCRAFQSFTRGGKTFVINTSGVGVCSGGKILIKILSGTPVPSFDDTAVGAKALPPKSRALCSPRCIIATGRIGKSSVVDFKRVRGGCAMMKRGGRGDLSVGAQHLGGVIARITPTRISDIKTMGNTCRRKKHFATFCELKNKLRCVGSGGKGLAPMCAGNNFLAKNAVDTLDSCGGNRVVATPANSVFGPTGKPLTGCLGGNSDNSPLFTCSSLSGG